MALDKQGDRRMIASLFCYIYLHKSYVLSKSKVDFPFSLKGWEKKRWVACWRSEDLVASTRFLVALVTSESQFRALHTHKAGWGFLLKFPRIRFTLVPFISEFDNIYCLKSYLALFNNNNNNLFIYIIIINLSLALAIVKLIDLRYFETHFLYLISDSPCCGIMQLFDPLLPLMKEAMKKVCIVHACN